VATTLSDEDFETIKHALQRATDSYGEDEIVDVLVALRKARRIVEPGWPQNKAGQAT
jgi:hypothetical protein